MFPVPFPEQNRTLRPPRNMTEEECSSLDVYSNGEQCISCWKLTPEEMMEVLQTGVVWVQIFSGDTQPPILIGVSRPFTEDDDG